MDYRLINQYTTTFLIPQLTNDQSTRHQILSAHQLTMDYRLLTNQPIHQFPNQPINCSEITVLHSQTDYRPLSELLNDLSFIHFLPVFYWYILWLELISVSEFFDLAQVVDEVIV